MLTLPSSAFLHKSNAIRAGIGAFMEDQWALLPHFRKPLWPKWSLKTWQYSASSIDTGGQISLIRNDTAEVLRLKRTLGKNGRFGKRAPRLKILPNLAISRQITSSTGIDTTWVNIWRFWRNLQNRQIWRYFANSVKLLHPLVSRTPLG